MTKLKRNVFLKPIQVTINSRIIPPSTNNQLNPRINIISRTQYIIKLIVKLVDIFRIILGIIHQFAISQLACIWVYSDVFVWFTEDEERHRDVIYQHWLNKTIEEYFILCLEDGFWLRCFLTSYWLYVFMDEWLADYSLIGLQDIYLSACSFDIFIDIIQSIIKVTSMFRVFLSYFF